MRPHSNLGYLTRQAHASALSGESGRRAANPEHSTQPLASQLNPGLNHLRLLLWTDDEPGSGLAVSSCRRASWIAKGKQIHMYQHILISTDGSEIAQKGLDHGLMLAKTLGAKVTIISITERLPMYPGIEGMSDAVYVGYGASQKEAAGKMLEAAKEAAGRAGVGAETVLIENALPAEAILETAKACNCDLIVMASHGRRGFRRLILGSVTSEVLAHSPVSVLVIR